jgi:ABC-type glutathione transport system ATPase component
MRAGAGVASLCVMTKTIEQQAVDTVVSVQDLRVRYGTTVAVDGVSLDIRRGEIFGILGPNGAGKTTTVECIGGLRTPDEGTISVLGLDASASGSSCSPRSSQTSSPSARCWSCSRPSTTIRPTRMS